MKSLDLTGSRYVRLVVLSRDEKKGKETRWNCICDCGTSKSISTSSLRTGKVSSCGCIRSEMHTKRLKTHGMSYTPTYRSWAAMRDRCSRKEHSHYASYGGRGIAVCERWQESFQEFLADMGERPHGTTLDRIDNDRGYSKDNCQWSTRSVQNKNQHHPKRPGLGMKLSHDGLTLTIKEWSSRLGIPVPTLHRRVKVGQPVHKVLSTSRLSANQYFRL